MVKIKSTAFLINYLSLLFFISSHIAEVALATTEVNLQIAEIDSLLLKHNPAIQLASLDYKIAKAEELAASLDLDINLNLGYYKEQKETKANSTLDRDRVLEKTTGLSGGLKKDLAQGIKLEASLQSLEIKSDSMVAIAPLRYQVASLFKVGIPILKGWGEDTKINKLKKAEAKVQRYREELRATIGDELKETLEIYLDLYKEQESLKIKRLSLENYENNLDFVKKEKDLGRKSEIDLLVAKADVEKQKSVLEKAAITLFDLNLKLMTKLEPLESKEVKQYLVSYTESNVDTYINSVVESKGEIKNPKILSLEYQIAESQVDVHKLKNSLLPQLDINLEGRSQAIDKIRRESFDQVANWKYPGYEISINFKFPLENLTAKGSYHEEESKYQGLNWRKRKIEEDIHNQLEKNKRTILELQARLQSMEKRLQNQKEQVKVKNQLYQLGKISALEISAIQYEWQDLNISKIELMILLAKEKLTKSKNLGQLFSEEKLESSINNI